MLNLMKVMNKVVKTQPSIVDLGQDILVQDEDLGEPASVIDAAMNLTNFKSMEKLSLTPGPSTCFISPSISSCSSPC